MENIVQLLLCVAIWQADIIIFFIKDLRAFKKWKIISKQYVIITFVPQKCFLLFLHFFQLSFKLESYSFMLWEMGKE